MNKLHKGAKRVLTGLLAAMMIVTAIPEYAFAAETTGDIDDNAIVTEVTDEGQTLNLTEAVSEPAAETEEDNDIDNNSGTEEISGTVETDNSDADDETAEASEDGDVDLLGTGEAAVECVDYMETEHYKVIPYDDIHGNQHIVDNKNDSTKPRYYVYGNSTSILVQVKVDIENYYELVDFKAKIGGKDAYVEEHDPINNVYKIQVDASGSSPITEDVTFEVEVEIPHYTLTYVTDAGVNDVVVYDDAENVIDNGDGTVTVYQADWDQMYVSFNVNTRPGKLIDKVMENHLGDEYETTINPENDKYEIQMDCDVTVTITTTTDPDANVLTAEAPEGVKVETYRKIDLKDDGTLESDEAVFGPFTEVLVKDNEKYTFVVSLDDSIKDYYEIASVKQDDNVLTAKFDTYKLSASEEELSGKSSEYYEAASFKGNSKITVTLKSKELTEDGFFYLNKDKAPDVVFTTADATLAAGSQNKYGFAKEKSDITFTAAVPGGKVVKAYLFDYDEGAASGYSGSAKELNLTKTVDIKKLQNIYTYKGSAAELNGKVIVLNELIDKPKELKILFGQGVRVPKVSTGGQYIEGDVEIAHPDDKDALSTVTFEVDAFEAVVITAEAGEHYKISEFLLNDEAQDNAVTSGSLSTIITDKTTVTIKASGIPTIYLGTEAYEDKATVNLRSDYTGELRIKRADSGDEIDTVTAKLSNKSVEGFAVLRESDHTYVDIDASKAASLGKGTIKVKLTGEAFGTKEISFVVAQNIDASKLSVKGFDKDKKAAQNNGTVVNYPINVEKGADIDRIGIASTDPGRFAVKKDAKGNPYVEATAFVNKIDEESGKEYCVLYQHQNLLFELKDNSTGKVFENTRYIIKVETTSFAAPTAKVVSASDVDVTLSLGLPKSALGYKNLYYMITAKAVEEIPEGSKMAATPAPKFVAADEESVTCHYNLTGLSAPILGDGQAVKYDISVGLIQVIDDHLALGTGEGQRFAAANFLQDPETITKKTLKNQSTRDPYYETKLSLNKKRTSLIAGERNVLVATGKFSKKTSYNLLMAASLTGPSITETWNTTSNSDIIRLTDDHTGVEIVDSYDFKPGKYTLTVFPYVPVDTLSTPAVMTIDVKACVNKIAINVPSYTMYKASGKAATMKLSAKAEYSCPPPAAYKPANSKVEWSIYSAGSDELEKALKIDKKKGTVTLDKGYVLSSVTDENKFRVMAKAVDLGDNAMRELRTITVTNAMLTPTSVIIGETAGALGKTAPTAVYSSILNGAPLIIKDGDKEVYNPGNLNNFTISISPKKGMTLNEGIISVTKTGTYTVKATTKDGSKQSISAKFKVISADLVESDPYEFNVRAVRPDGSYSDKIDNEGTVSDVAYLMVEARAKTNGGDCAINKGKPVLSFNGAKKFKTTGDSSTVAYIKPEKADIEITVTDKSLKKNGKNYTKTHKISISDFASKGKINAPSDCSVWQGGSGGRLFETTMSDVSCSSLQGKTVALIASLSESDMAKGSDKLKNINRFVEIFNNEGYFNWDKDSDDDQKAGKLYVRFENTSNIYKLPVGKYSFNLTLCTIDDLGGVHMVTDPLKLTLKVKKGPAVKASLKTKLNFAADAESAELKFKTKKNVEQLRIVSVLNDIQDGKSSGFDKYFTCALEDNKIIIRKKDGSDNLKPGAKYSFIIYYQAIGEDASYANAVQKFERVTITIGKPEK